MRQGRAFGAEDQAFIEVQTGLSLEEACDTPKVNAEVNGETSVGNKEPQNKESIGISRSTRGNGHSEQKDDKAREGPMENNVAHVTETAQHGARRSGRPISITVV